MEVLVSGAGPTGLTLAIELARRGVGVRVLDKAEQPFHGSRGDGLQPRTLEVFEDLGVLDAVLEAGQPPVALRVHLNGEFVAERWMGELVEPTPDLPYPNPWVLGQSHTEQILRERLATFGVRVEQGTELVGFGQDDSGVDAELRRDGVATRVRVDYLVGADGGKSFVRKTLGIPFTGVTDESIRLLLGDVTAAGLDHAYGYWFTASEETRAGIAMTPLPGGNLFQFSAPLDSDTADVSLAGLQTQLDQVTGGAGIRLGELAWSTVWRPNIRLADRYREGRVFLAGDAAHVHPPTGGQGLNTGVQDAYNLGWKLASETALDTYEAERRPVAAEVLGLSTALVRKYVEGAADAHRRGRAYHQLDISYAIGERAGRVVTGDRAPDAPVENPDGKPVRLFELFRGPHATTLAFGCAAPDEPHAYAVVKPGETVPGAYVVDVGGHAFAGYDVTPGTTVRIRPDGYVGGVSR